MAICLPSRERLTLRGNECPANDTSLTATSLGLTGFFFPLFKPVLGVDCHPPIRQQGFQCSSVIGRNCWKAS
jgi:hypothetical protein